MKISDWKIGLRLGGGFGILMLLVVAMAVAGAWRLQVVGDLTRDMVDDAVMKERLTAEWHRLTGMTGTMVLALARAAVAAAARGDIGRAQTRGHGRARPHQ